MDIAELKNQIDYVQARIDEIDKKIINSEPDQKGYKELVDSYNKWIDRYDEMIDRLEHFDDVDIERKKLELEERRVNLEHDKLKISEQIEQDKVNVEVEKVRLEREKFAFETTDTKNKELMDLILRSADLGVKILVPLIGLKGTLTIARLAYTSDLDLKLCNGRIWGLLKLGSMKV